MASSGSSWARSTPEISAPSAPATRRIVRDWLISAAPGSWGRHATMTLGGQDMDISTRRFDADAHAARIREQGFTIIEDFLDEAGLAAFRSAIAPFLGSHRGRNDFEGFETE